MTYFLENAALQLSINPNTARWSVVSRQRNGPSIRDSRVGFHYRRGFIQYQALDRWPSLEVSTIETIPSPHGPLRQISLAIGLDRKGESQIRPDLYYTLTFAVSEEHPLLLWKMSVENRGRRPIYVDQLELLSVGFVYPSRSGPHGSIDLFTLPETRIARSEINLDESYRLARRRSQRLPVAGATEDLAFFSNGWQSWSFSGAYGSEDNYRRTRLGFFTRPMTANAGTPQPKRRGLFASDMFGVLGDRSHRMAILAGFLSQKSHFGSLEAWIATTSPALRLWANGDDARLDPGAQMTTDWACLCFLHLDTHDPLAPYLNAVSREHEIDPVRLSVEIPAGWSSWYQFDSDEEAGRITETNIRENLSAAARLNSELPLHLIQIDDGFESQVGDWFTFSSRFPDGVAQLAADIRRQGFSPGLWLAPFILHPKSRLFAKHPDWLLRGRLGRPVNAGYLWDTFPTALDLTHPEALDYARQVVSTAVQEWGFEFLKLDFLYAAALPGRHKDPTRTRAQVLRAGLEAVREAAGEGTFLLGCGCPLGPAIGLVDAMRIGADVARGWRPAIKGIEFYFKSEPNLPSARNATHNALTRAAFHRRWWINDPYCLLVRAETLLTLPEVQTLATVIAFSGGSILLSDHLPDLAPDRLRIAEVLLPPIGARPHLLDWFDYSTPARLQIDLESPAGTWHMLGLFNWDDEPRDLRLDVRDFYLSPRGEYYAHEFWSGRTYLFSVGAGLRPFPAETRPYLTLLGIPPHGSVVLAVRPYRPYRPQYLGSDLHISQGLEVSGWEWKSAPGSTQAGELGLCLHRPGRASGKVDLGLPRPPQEALLDGQPIGWEALGGENYRFAVTFERDAYIQIRLP